MRKYAITDTSGLVWRVYESDPAFPLLKKLEKVMELADVRLPPRVLATGTVSPMLVDSAKLYMHDYGDLQTDPPDPDIDKLIIQATDTYLTLKFLLDH